MDVDRSASIERDDLIDRLICWNGRRHPQRVLHKDAAYLAVSSAIAGLCKDNKHQVGCTLVRKNRVVGIGYNGMPSKIGNDSVSWHDGVPIYNHTTGDDPHLGLKYLTRMYSKVTSRDEGYINTKTPYVVHAEINALLNALSGGSSVEDATAYVTLSPCSDCACALIQAGVKRIVFMDGSNLFARKPKYVAGAIACEKAGVLLERWVSRRPRIIWEDEDESKAIEFPHSMGIWTEEVSSHYVVHHRQRESVTPDPYIREEVVAHPHTFVPRLPEFEPFEFR